MPKITYRDLDKSAPVVSWFGIEFRHGEPVDLDTQKQLTKEQKEEMCMRADASAFYHVESKAGRGEVPDAPPPGIERPEPPPDQADVDDYKEGWDAATAGSKRDGRRTADWLRGFDECIAEMERVATTIPIKDNSIDRHKK